MAAGRNVLDRFAEKVDWPAVVTGCWRWRAGRDKDGYGCMFFNAQRGKVRAHRISYELARGPIPPGLVIDHLCRVRHCVNPAHLELVSIAENTRRGEPCRARMAKTHCPSGHPYDDANTRRNPNGGRACKACNRRVVAARKARLRSGGAA